MAKAYRAKHDVSFPRVLSRSGEGENATEATEGTNYPAGSIVRHDTLPRHVQERVESGDLDHTLEPMSDEDAEATEGYGDVEPEYGVFVAEHEAEAHALEAAGHYVVPQEQVMEVLSSGEEHKARYQAAVKEAGLDRRPNQEFLAQERERVPDHVLYGAQTPAGVPHNRGPEQMQPDEGDEEGAREDGTQTQGGSAVRARPQFGRESEAVGPEAEGQPVNVQQPPAEGGQPGQAV